MPEYLVELYVSGANADEVSEEVVRARGAAEQCGIGLLRAFFIPEDETCFCFYAAQSGGVVNEAVTRAGLHAERIVEAIPAPFEG